MWSKELNRDTDCEVHQHLMPDGRCTCNPPKDGHVEKIGKDFEDTWFAFTQEVISSLIRERDSLSYQLSFAKGLITEKQFQSIEPQLLWEPRVVPDLMLKTLLLAELVPDQITPELVSVVFRCSLSDAQNVIPYMIKQGTE